MSGYSKKSLRDKLGIKSGYSVVLMNTPLSYIVEIGDLSDVELYPTPKKDHDFVHIFVKEKDELKEYLHALLRAIKPTGIIWVSWPKGSSGVKTDVNENLIREIALPLGLVDVKVAAIDGVWSGLKLVVRIENR